MKSKPKTRDSETREVYEIVKRPGKAAFLFRIPSHTLRLRKDGNGVVQVIGGEVVARLDWEELAVIKRG